jgi:flagellin
MPFSIITNPVDSQTAQAISSANKAIETSMERLSTGSRINSASDDAAGVAISSRFNSEILGANQAIRNALDGQALIDTAEGAHKEIGNILQRMRELAVQSANDTNNSDDRTVLQAEMDKMIIEIDRIANVTSWAGQKLLDGTASAINLHVGSGTQSANTVLISISSMTSFSQDLLADRIEPGQNMTRTGSSFKDTFSVIADNTVTGLTFQNSNGSSENHNYADGDVSYTRAVYANAYAYKFNTDTSMASAYNVQYNYPDTSFTVTRTLQITSSDLAMSTIERIDTTLKTVNNQRSALGAISNRLNYTVKNLTNMSGNLQAGKSQVEDADYARETTRLAKNQILSDISTAILAQSNAHKQHVMGLLQG